MKVIVENRDINNPDEFKELEPVEFSIGSLEAEPESFVPSFSAAIEAAANDASSAIEAQEQAQQRRRAQEAVEAGFKALAASVKAEFGLAVGYDRPWVYRPKAKVAYNLWKRVIPLFLQDPKVLDMGVTELAKWLDAHEPNYTVKRDLMYDGLNPLAKAELGRLLKKHGVELPLKGKVTIRSVQKALKERRDSALDLEREEFTAHIVIRGDMAFVNGKGFKIQLGSSGKRRVKRMGKEWLPLDTLKGFCSE